MCCEEGKEVSEEKLMEDHPTELSNEVHWYRVSNTDKKILILHALHGQDRRGKSFIKHRSATASQ